MESILCNLFYIALCMQLINFIDHLHIKNFPFLSFLYFSLFLNLVCFVIFHFVPITFCSIPFRSKNVCYSKFLWFVIELFISPHYLHFPFSITYRSISIGYKFHATLQIFDFTYFSFYSKCNSYSYSWHVTQFYNFTLDLSFIPLSHSIPRCAPSSCKAVINELRITTSEFMNY